MDKYIIAPPAGSTNNAIGANDRRWAKGYFNELPGWQEYVEESTGYGIIRGCTPSISGLVVSAASGIVHLSSGLRIEYAGGSVTLDAADLVKPRTDLVYIDENGALQKETGTLGTVAVAGSNTYTITTNFANNDTIKLEGVTITATTGTQDSTHFVIGADVSESATNFALTVNANTTLNATYTATASSGVVTVTETTAGGGNTPGVVTVTGTGAITNGTPTDSTPPMSTPPATPANGIAVCTVAIAAGASTGTLKDTRDIKYNTDALREYVKTFRMASTVYSVSDIRYYPDLPVGWYLECTTAGTSASGDITLPTPLVENATITDGTCVWKVRRILSADSMDGKVDKSDMPFNGITNNSIYRGKDLTAYFESGQMSADMATGKWDNIFVGDYIIKSVTINGVTYADVKWIIMHINYHLHCGDTETTQNHVVLMPEEQLGTRQMNPTDTTAGGYVGSAMWNTHMPLVVAGIEAAFGADHVLAHRELLTNAMNGDLISANWTAARGATSGWAWVTAKANLATEEMVYGAPIWSSSAHDSSGDTMQLAAFKLNRGLICSKRYWWWLRSVANASYFCYASDDGGAGDYAASSSGGGVRPYFLLH